MKNTALLTEISAKKGFLAELNFTNRYYQLPENFYQYQLPTEIKQPYLIHINPKMAEELDFDATAIDPQLFAEFSSGNLLLEESEPTASIYAGHQFGYFVPELGDGRAILLGEIQNKNNQHWELQLKGAGQTPFSRNADGRAVLRSTIREYLCSEAMAGLGIPTTRSLSIVGSAEEVYRETLEYGAVMLRMSPSFIRFGSFELFASRGQDEQIKQLADFVIKTFFTEINNETDDNPYQQFFQQVIIKTAQLIAKWQAVGFAHGVMNTDNMSILGLTIDYGPFGFLDAYDSQFICNHSDHQGRYRFDNQPNIGFWNLNCLARALQSLLSVEEAKQALSLYESTYDSHYLYLMQQKLGLFDIKEQQYESLQLQNKGLQPKDESLIDSLLQLMESNQVDYTLFFRQLSNEDHSNCAEMFSDKNGFAQWLQNYEDALTTQSLCPADRKIKMDNINPKYILRNYIAQIIIEKVEHEKDFSFLDQWLKVLQSPYDEHPQMESFAGYPPPWAAEISVSCSS